MSRCLRSCSFQILLINFIMSSRFSMHRFKSILLIPVLHWQLHQPAFPWEGKYRDAKIAHFLADGSAADP